MRHLTRSGQRDAIWYAIRSIFIKPAPEGQRCIMGYNVSESVRCPHKTVDDDQLWCRKHLADWLGVR